MALLRILPQASARRRLAALLLAALLGPQVPTQDLDFTASRLAVATTLLDAGQTEHAAMLLYTERQRHALDALPAAVADLSQRADRTWRQLHRDRSLAVRPLVEVYEAWVDEGRLRAALRLLPDIARISYQEAAVLLEELREALEPERLSNLRAPLPHFHHDAVADVRACLRVGNDALQREDLDVATQAWLEARRRFAEVDERGARRALSEELDDLGGELGRTIRDLDRAEAEAIRRLGSIAKRYTREGWQQTAASVLGPVASWGDPKALKSFQAAREALPRQTRIHLADDRNLIPWLFVPSGGYTRRGTTMISPPDANPGMLLLEADPLEPCATLHGTLQLRLPDRDCTAGIAIGKPGDGCVALVTHVGLESRVMLVTSVAIDGVFQILAVDRFQRRPDEPREQRLDFRIHDGQLYAAVGNHGVGTPMDGFDGFLALAQNYGAEPQFTHPEGAVYESLWLESW